MECKGPCLVFLSHFLLECQAKDAAQYWYSSCSRCVEGVCQVVTSICSMLSFGRSVSVCAEIECAEMSMTWM